MLSQEALERLEVITKPQQANLEASVASAEEVRQQLADAKIGVATAKANVKEAEQSLEGAEMTVRQLESAEQGAEKKVESVAKDVAETIIRDPEIEPRTKTLFSLLYNDRKLAWQDGHDAYQKAVDRGKVALSSVIERLQLPDAPILYFSNQRVIADTATDKSLVTKPPKATNKCSDPYASIEDGSISIVMPDTATTHVTDQGLVVVEQDTVEAVLMSNMFGYDLEHLESAATNNHWLIIGEEAVTAKVQELEPIKKFVALTALNAVGVELDTSVEPELKTKTEQSLISLLAFLASGTGQETTTRTVRRRDAWTGGSHSSQVTEDTPLSLMAKSVNKKSIRLMAQTLGISKETLRTKVADTLNSRVAQDTASLDQLAKDVQAIETLNSILDSIF